MKLFLPFLAALAVVLFMGNQQTVIETIKAVARVDTTLFVNSQVDTISYVRPAGLEGFSFAPHWKDSVSVTNAIMRRVVNGEIRAAIAGDTLFGALASTSADTSLLVTATLAPLAERYVVIVTYAGSANGVTTPVVTYAFNQQIGDH